MAFVLELTAFSHHDDGDILERHILLSDPNAENVALFRDQVAEAFEMSGYLTEEHGEFDHYSRTPHDQGTYAVGLKVVPTLFDEEPDAQHLALTLGSLARFDLGERTPPRVTPPQHKRVLVLHTVFENPPVVRTPLGVGSVAQLDVLKVRTEALFEELGFQPEKVTCEGETYHGFRRDHRSAFFTDEPLETTIGSSDTELLRCLLNAACLTDLRDFSFNPAGLQGLLKHGLLQWD